MRSFDALLREIVSAIRKTDRELVVEYALKSKK